MTKLELTLADQMEVIESQWYPEASAYKAARLAVEAAKGLSELTEANVKLTARAGQCNFLLDKWLDLREMEGTSGSGPV